MYKWWKHFAQTLTLTHLQNENHPKLSVTKNARSVIDSKNIEINCSFACPKHHQRKLYCIDNITIVATELLYFLLAILYTNLDY